MRNYKQFLLGIVIGFAMLTFGKAVFSKTIFGRPIEPSMNMIVSNEQYSIYLDKNIRYSENLIYAKTLHTYNNCLKVDNNCVLSIISINEYDCKNQTKTVIRQNLINSAEDKIMTTSLINIKNNQEIKEICNKYEVK